MKKLFTCLGAILLFFIMASMASAGTLTTGLGAPVFYPSAAVKGDNDTIDFTGAPSTVPPAVVQVNPSTNLITYTPSIELPSSTRIVFTLTNGKFADAKIHLLTAGLTSVASTDTITATATGAEATFIVGNASIPANTALTLSSDPGVQTNIKVTMLSPLAVAGAKVTLQVTKCFDVIGPISGGLTAAVTLIESYQQLAFFVQAGTATIDVEPDSFRRLFLPGQYVVSPALNQSFGYVTFVDQYFAGTLTITPTFVLALAQPTAVANLNYEVTGGQLLKLTKLFLQAGCNPPTQDFKIDSDTEATATFAVSNNPPFWFDAPGANNICGDTLNFLVNGTDTLSPQTFYIEGKLDFVDDTLYTDVVLSSQVIMTWDINAWQGQLPYMFASANGPAQDCFIKIFNNGPRAADVTVDLNTDSGATKATNLVLGTIPAGAVGIFYAADIAAAAGVPLDSSFAALFTVNSPTKSVTAIAVQKRPSANDRVLPIYTLDGGSTYRQF